MNEFVYEPINKVRSQTLIVCFGTRPKAVARYLKNRLKYMPSGVNRVVKIRSYDLDTELELEVPQPTMTRYEKLSSNEFYALYSPPKKLVENALETFDLCYFPKLNISPDLERNVGGAQIKIFTQIAYNKEGAKIIDNIKAEIERMAESTNVRKAQEEGIFWRNS